MALSTAGLNAEVTAVAAVAGYLSLHSATPNGSGSNETTAARVAVTWGSASAGAVAMSGGARNFTGGASNGAVAAVGIWSASSGGTYYGAFAQTGDASFNSAGEYTVDSFTLTAS